MKKKLRHIFYLATKWIGRTRLSQYFRAIFHFFGIIGHYDEGTAIRQKCNDNQIDLDVLKRTTYALKHIFSLLFLVLAIGLVVTLIGGILSFFYIRLFN